MKASKSPLISLEYDKNLRYGGDLSGGAHALEN